MRPPLDLRRPVVVGFGVTGQAIVRALLDHGHRPVAFDDNPRETASAVADEWRVELQSGATDIDGWLDRLADASVVLPSPGIPASHPVFEAVQRIDAPVRSEFDLAALWDQRPLVGITGTNGKTTVTMLVTEALNRSGVPAAAVGNTEVPLVAALSDASVEVFVVEASSFRLAHSGWFAPHVATWLNFAPDHLDAHPTLDGYEAAKASLWRAAGPGSGITVVANADDPTVMRHLPEGATAVTFGLESRDATWRIVDGVLVGPDGPLLAVDRLQRRQPHDLANALAVAATALLAGATPSGVVSALEDFAGFAHRLEFVGEWDGIRWFNDSKATVPQAALAAVGGFESVVLIAGGKNKGLDLAPLVDAAPRLRAVVATGAAGTEVAELFDGRVPVELAKSMAEAVDIARRFADPGDVVLLSPACTSYDWYTSYSERGDDFKRIVYERVGRGTGQDEERCQ